MRWQTSALWLALAAALFAISEPREQAAVAIETPGAGEVVPPGFDRVHPVLVDRAPDLEPGLRRDVAKAIAEEAARGGFDPLLILALIDVESDFQLEVVSPMGARGLMQLRPATLEYLAEKEGLAVPNGRSADPVLEVRLGVRYLKSLKDRFRTLDHALLAYNLGPTKLVRVWRAKELGQYQGYLRAVQRDYAQLQREQGTPGDWTLASR